MAYAAPPNPHGGGYNPNGSEFVPFNSQPPYQQAHGGGFVPGNTPYSTRPVLTQGSPAHGGGFNPTSNSPFVIQPVFAQPQPFAVSTPAYKPQLHSSVQETANPYPHSTQYTPKPNPLAQLCSCLR
jgi:hypothetical protein